VIWLGTGNKSRNRGDKGYSNHLLARMEESTRFYNPKPTTERRHPAWLEGLGWDLLLKTVSYASEIYNTALNVSEMCCLPE
jgi:hypothetical protein